ncbi:MAG TPA: flagellar biosynthetic protein FliR [Desulfobulbaceae bacterium]|nr:flagellar biosynthetic protein FliR [Desulfobulbaceae bacterium]HHD63732.1 flagellar biosynthetic protein FliR [Desulfobulbaceae bacterium]
MDIQLVPIEQFQTFLLCFSRVMAILAAVPVINSRQAPPQVRIGLGFATALLLFPLMASHTPKIDFSLMEFALVMANEILIGLLLGLVAQLIFTAVSFGGTIIGYQMGFAAANIFDPQTTQQLSIMSQFSNIISILIFLALNLHHIFFKVIVDSYILLPPGTLDFSSGAIPLLMDLAGHMFLLSIKLSAPILALLLISNLVLGILARIFPQLNVFMLSFPMNIGIALLVIGLTLHILPLMLSREFDTMGENFFRLFQML